MLSRFRHYGPYRMGFLLLLMITGYSLAGCAAYSALLSEWSQVGTKEDPQNSDRPGEVDAGEPYMVSAIAMQRFSQNSTWHNEAQFVIPILKGERFRLLVVAGERAGLSREMVVGERGDPSLLPCVEPGTIALKRVPDDARSDPHRFRQYPGM